MADETLADILLERPGIIRGGKEHRRGDQLPAGVGRDWETTRDPRTGDVLFVPPPGYKPPPPNMLPKEFYDTHRPNDIADYFDRRADHWKWERNKSLAASPFMAAQALTSSVRPEMGRFMRGVGRTLQIGGMTTGAAYGLLGWEEHNRMKRAQRAADMWRKTGLPGSPDPSERMAVGGDPEEADRLLKFILGPQVPVSR